MAMIKERGYVSDIDLEDAADRVNIEILMDKCMYCSYRFTVAHEREIYIVTHPSFSKLTVGQNSHYLKWLLALVVSAFL